MQLCVGGDKRGQCHPWNNFSADLHELGGGDWIPATVRYFAMINRAVGGSEDLHLVAIRL